MQVSCIKHVDQYIPPLWVMCLESVAHLLVMFNFSSNFLIYCSVSHQFKAALSKVCLLFCQKTSRPLLIEPSEYQSLPASMMPQASNSNLELLDVATDQLASHENGKNGKDVKLEDIIVHVDSDKLQICRV